MSNAGLVAALALLAALAVAGCGGDEAGDEAARHLDPRSDAVIAVDLDYDGANWEQVKRLYALVIESGAFEGGGPVPPTLEGAFGAAAASAGLSFGDDVKPLPGGTLHAGLPVEPAEPLSPGARDVLERLDDDATRFRRGVPRYVGRVPPGGSGRARARIEKLRGQGLREQPVPGIEDAVCLTDGVGVVGGDTIVVAVGSDGPDDGLLRERLAQEERAQAPESDGAFIPARAAPALLGAVLDRGELVRALATDAGSALREDFELQLLRALVARAEASASARDGDIEADAELLWARP